jgi:NurA-like 5'-3' nuclease
MSGGEIAGLIAAGAFALLVLVACYVLLKMGRIFDETAARVRQTTATIDEGTARVKQAGETVDEINTALAHVNFELAKVEIITANVETMSKNMAALTSILATTFGSPVIKVAAFSYGVRRAASRQSRGEVETRIRDRVKAERAAGKAAKAPRKGR